MAIGDDLLRILPDVQTKCIDSKVSKYNMHSHPKKIGQMMANVVWWLWVLPFYHIHGLPEISPHLPLTWVLISLWSEVAVTTLDDPAQKISQLMCSRYSVETAPRNSNKLSPLPSKSCRTIPHGRFTIGYTTWLMNPWQRLDQRSGCVREASPIPAKPHKSTNCPVTSPFGKGQSDPPHSPP